jgi:hypothetical protein
VLTDLYSLLIVILRQFLKVLGRNILALLFGQKSAGNKLVSSHETQMTAQEPFHILFMGPNRDITDLYSLLMVILRQFLMKVGRKILAYCNLVRNQLETSLLAAMRPKRLMLRNHSIFSLYRSQKGCDGMLTVLYSLLMVILRQFLMKVGRKILALAYCDLVRNQLETSLLAAMIDPND